MEVFAIKALQIISGNDNGGGSNHVLNLSIYSKNRFHCTIGAIGGGPLYEKAKLLDIDVVQFQKNSVYNGEILNYIRKNNIDVVNFHGAKAFFMHAFLKNKLKIPSVATIHSNYRKDFLNNKFKKIFFTPLSIMGLKSFKYLICMSKYIKNLTEKDKLMGKKFLVNNGIDYNSIRITKSREYIRKFYSINDTDFVYVNVARMHPIKNHVNLIQAFGKLKKQNKDIKLILAGDGEREKEIKELIKKMGLCKDIITTGFVNDPVNYVNASEISILTSFSEGGSPPLVVLESAALKKAFICSRVGDIEETLNSERGFLVNPNSVDDIYAKMKEAYSKRENIKVMGENLYNFVMKQYSMNSFCDQYYNAYKEILLGK